MNRLNTDKCIFSQSEKILLGKALYKTLRIIEDNKKNSLKIKLNYMLSFGLQVIKYSCLGKKHIENYRSFLKEFRDNCIVEENTEYIDE